MVHRADVAHDQVPIGVGPVGGAFDGLVQPRVVPSGVVGDVGPVEGGVVETVHNGGVQGRDQDLRRDVVLLTEPEHEEAAEEQDQ
jgi:hypothetical protein